MSRLSNLNLDSGSKAVVLVGMVLVCYYLYTIEKRHRQQLRAMHNHSRGMHNALAAIHQEVRDEDEDAELVAQAEESVEQVREQAEEADAGN